MNLKNWDHLENLASSVGIEVDPKNPRESRLKVAYAYDELGNVQTAIEVMHGIPAHADDMMQVMVLSMQRKKSTREKFYNDFAPVDTN